MIKLKKAAEQLRKGEITIKAGDAAQMVESLVEILNNPHISTTIKRKIYPTYMALETSLILQVGNKMVDYKADRRRENEE